MLSTHQPPPDRSDADGGLSHESAPQVIVRAGKTWVCSACGVLIELPPEVVGQLVIQPEPAPPEPSQSQPPDEDSFAEEPAQEMPGEPSPKIDPRPAQERSPRSSTRPKRRPHVAAQAERIDGLIVPTTGQLRRLLAWINYRCQRLAELKRCEKQLAARWAPPRPPATGRQSNGRRRPAQKVPLRRLARVASWEKPSPAPVVTCTPVRSDTEHQRGPP